MGSVSQAIVEDQMTKKPPKELGDFYRFQKREAQRNGGINLSCHCCCSIAAFLIQNIRHAYEMDSLVIVSHPTWITA